MRSLQRLIGLSALALLCACVSTNQPAPVSAAAGLSAGSPATEPATVSVQTRATSRNNGECREEARTGSHFTSNRCMSKRQREEIRNQAQEWMRTGGDFGSTMTVH